MTTKIGMGCPSLFPRLVFSSEPERDQWNFFDVANNTNQLKRWPGLEQYSAATNMFMSTPADGGWVLLADRNSDDLSLFLFNLTSTQRIPVPAIDDDLHKFSFSMPYPPSHPNSSFVAVHESKPYWLQFHPGRDDSLQFTKHPFDDDELFYFSDATAAYDGKVYASGYCLQVIDTVSATAERYKVSFPATFPCSYGLLHAMVAAGDGLLMVRRNYYFDSDVLHSVDVAKLDLANKAWVRLDDMGDRVLFIGESCSVACSASAAGGIKGNRVYFVEDSDEQRLCCYDLGDGCLTTYMPVAGNDTVYVRPRWVVVPDEQEDADSTVDTTHDRDGEANTVAEEVDVDLTEKLVVDDPKMMPTNTPCLLFTHKNDGFYNLVDPFTKKRSILHFPQLAGAALYSSKAGWSVVHKTKEQLFLFNIFTRTEIQLPPLPPIYAYFFNGLALSSAPTSSDCMLFGLTSTCNSGETQTVFCRLGDSEWTVQTFSTEKQGGDFSPSHSSAVFHNGLFYKLGVDGALGVYDHNKQTWSVLSCRLEEDQLNFEVGQCFLVEREGKLLSVFMERYYDYPREVFQLQDGMDGWEKTSDFGDGLLFVGRYGSEFLTAAPTEESKNSICLPKFELEGDYDPVIIDPWDHDPNDTCFYDSIEYTLNSCWVTLLQQ